MEQETNADRIRDIEADALSAVNDDEQEESNDLIDFKYVETEVLIFASLIEIEYMLRSLHSQIRRKDGK